jgi:hypothetical protein
MHPSHSSGEEVDKHTVIWDDFCESYLQMTINCLGELENFPQNATGKEVYQRKGRIISDRQKSVQRHR